MRTDLKPFRKSGLANCFGRQQNRSKEGFQCWFPRARWTQISCLPSGGSKTSHMHLHHTSTQQRAALRPPTTWRRLPAQLDSPGKLRAAGVDGTGRLSQVSARSPIHEAKTAIIVEMGELDRPVTSKELYARLDRAWSLKAIEYHLSTLVNTGVVEIVFGPELHFSLTERGTKRFTRERCR
jgi:hypothetical protein